MTRPSPRPRAADPALAARLRRRTGAGSPLPDPVRELLQDRLDADLGAVRVHTDAEADALAATLGATAFAHGADLYFRSGTFDPSGPAGLRLLTHEVVHALQQSASDPGRRGSVTVDPDPAQELAANRIAAAVVTGAPLPRASLPHEVRRLDRPMAVQRHASWEHRLLGDAQPADLDAIARKLPNRTQLLSDLRDFLYMWHQDPASVTEQMIVARYPYIRTVTLRNSGLLVTYGELNTLPDYMANPTVLDEQPASILLPILQAVRQEGYNRIQQMLGGSGASFNGAVGFNTGWDFIDLLIETKAVDNLTYNIGPNHTNHYTALVGRNACHFAPFSWYRWEQFYLIAVGCAQKAYAATDPTEKANWTYGAWMNHGYADHFLQDSFAAGHLVNKTLIMQWFVDWAKGKWYVPVANWNAVATMTQPQQPGLSAQGLYDMGNPGSVRDPQTSEEQATEAERMAMCGVQAAGSISQQQAYQNYLSFLDSTVVQSASGVLHDYYNARSLWVASANQTTPFQIWGDDTMLDGGDGVRIASETAQMSQQSILDTLSSGTSSITTQAIKDRFPTSAVDPVGQLQPLADWHNSIKEQAYALFPAVHYFLLRAIPTIGYVSVDQSAPALAASLAALAPGLPAHAPTS